MSTREQRAGRCAGKEQRWSRFIAGALVGSLVFTATGAWAASRTKVLEVVYNDIKIMVNGQIVPTSKEPFIYEGTTYLPVRAVAEALGQQVQWDGATNTVIIGKKPDGDFLTDLMKPYATRNLNNLVQNNEGTGNQMVMAGVRYNKGVQFLKYLGWSFDGVSVLDYNLNGRFTRLTGKIGADDLRNEIADNNYLIFVIKGDDQELTRFEYHKGDLPKEIDLSVSGVLRLTIEVTAQNYFSGQAYIDIVDLMVR